MKGRRTWAVELLTMPLLLTRLKQPQYLDTSSKNGGVGVLDVVIPRASQGSKFKTDAYHCDFNEALAVSLVM